jgi:transcription elongation factor
MHRVLGFHSRVSFFYKGKYISKENAVVSYNKEKNFIYIKEDYETLFGGRSYYINEIYNLNVYDENDNEFESINPKIIL